jgi:hypothetical protein
MRKSKNICIGKRGGNFVYQKMVEVWVLDIYTVLTYPCWLNRFGDYLVNRNLYVQGS